MSKCINASLAQIFARIDLFCLLVLAKMALQLLFQVFTCLQMVIAEPVLQILLDCALCHIVPYCACAAVWRRTVFHASQQQRVIFMVFKFAKACAWLATAMGWPASVPEVPWGRYGPVAGFLRMTNGFKSCILAYPCHPSKTCANFILVARL